MVCYSVTIVSDDLLFSAKRQDIVSVFQELLRNEAMLFVRSEEKLATIEKSCCESAAPFLSPSVRLPELFSRLIQQVERFDRTTYDPADFFVHRGQNASLSSWIAAARAQTKFETRFTPKRRAMRSLRQGTAVSGDMPLWLGVIHATHLDAWIECIDEEGRRTIKRPWVLMPVGPLASLIVNRANPRVPFSCIVGCSTVRREASSKGTLQMVSRR